GSGVRGGLEVNGWRGAMEGAGIGPERGVFSMAALEHYRRMLAACLENDVIPMVTFYHFSSPRWFAAMGGWEKSPAADLFARYCERTAQSLGDLIAYASTFNAPNLPMLLRWVTHIEVPFATALLMGKRAARAVGSGNFGCFFLGNAQKLQEVMIAAHHRAMIALKSGPGRYPVGVNVAMQDEHAVG